MPKKECNNCSFLCAAHNAAPVFFFFAFFHFASTAITLPLVHRINFTSAFLFTPRDPLVYAWLVYVRYQTPSFEFTPWRQTQQVPGGSEQYEFFEGGLSPGTLYQVRFRGISLAGDQPFTQQVSFVTPTLGRCAPLVQSVSCTWS